MRSPSPATEWVYGILNMLDSGIRRGGQVENVKDNGPLKKKVLKMGRTVILVAYAALIGSLVRRHWYFRGSSRGWDSALKWLTLFCRLLAFIVASGNFLSTFPTDDPLLSLH